MNNAHNSTSLSLRDEVQQIADIGFDAHVEENLYALVGMVGLLTQQVGRVADALEARNER